ncbi:unnamed protein product [Arabidopsis halleri]
MRNDIISELPESLITQILLLLPTKDSIKTSVLSTRWRNLWLKVPGLDLNSDDFRFPYRDIIKNFTERFLEFMERFREFNHGSNLQKFDITYFECNGYRDRLMELISTVVDRGIQHLYVYMHTCKKDDFIRQNIYKSKTLVSLKLFNVGLKNPEFVVSLPCLKIMLLCNVCYSEDGPLVVEKLISGCPVLEDLQLSRPFDISSQKVVMFLRVSSQTLESLRLYFRRDSGTDFSVEIDAPRLNYMSVRESQYESILVKNLSSLFRIDIHTKFNRFRLEDLQMNDIFYGFLTGISRVRRMIICLRTLERLYPYSKFGPIPEFLNLYHLKAQVRSSSLQLLQAFLESCPNLKNLILEYSVTVDLEQTDFTNVPRCLISTLEYVEITKPMTRDETGVKLVNYFLENSTVLKKLTISFTGSSFRELELESYKMLLTSTKLSPTCQVIIV